MTEQPEKPARKKPAPGWYPHKTMADTQRYWDGEAWTDHIAPSGASRPGGPAPQPGGGTGVMTIAMGIIVAVVLLGLVGWLVYGVVTADDDLDCATESAERVLDGLPPLDCN